MKVLVVVTLLTLAVALFAAVPTYPPVITPGLQLTEWHWHCHGPEGVPYYYADIDGTVKNNTQTLFSRVTVEIGVYNKQGVKVKTIMARGRSLGPGESWQFCTDPGITPQIGTNVMKTYDVKLIRIEATK